ncbi:MAG TPA: AMP-binding protein [Prolixibacteraceae bacterium]
MSKIQTAVRINGQNYTSDELILLIAERLSLSQQHEWEREFFLFLQDWFSPSDFIEAQTSGSTGMPQIIQLPKTAMQQSACRTIEFFGLQAGNRVLLSLPCRFIAGKMMVVRAIIGQMDLITVDPSTDFEILRTETFDFGAMVPNQVFKLLESPLGRGEIENIRNLLIGGSSIPVNLGMQIGQLANRVVSTYGMTETASHIAIRELSGEKRSDIYHCLPGIFVTSGENDCLQIHIPECTQSLQTKDIAEILSPASFRILGRVDDAIISGGIKYWPENIEKTLQSVIHRRFVISSLPDEKLGEKLVLVIEGEAADVELISQKSKELLPSFGRPKAIYFLDKFPETPNGKLKRNEIKGAINRLFLHD